MSLDPRLLRAFVVLAEELHFTRAARRLHMAQPALSQQIKRLELQLGVEVFERTRSSVRLAAPGRELLGPARAAVEAAATVEEVAAAFARGERGELRLGFSPGVHYVAQALLAELGQRLPDLRVRARQDSSGALAEGVANGELELAVGFSTEPRPGIVCERLVEAPAVVAVASGHRLARQRSLSLRDLSSERFALVDPRDGAGYNRAVVELCRRAGFEPRTATDPHGPMAWETAVRTGGCAGLTTRSSAASTARGLRLIDLRERAVFLLQLVRPARPLESWRPAARAFRALSREMAAAAALG
jgi:LysR family transcriptional regulator, benzoate and cis,cis-muconate-responsive activator of ben and cat genes